MPERKKRHRKNFNEPGHAHELTFSCYHGLPLLKSERICQWMAESINLAREELRFNVWAYVFMPEHVHLLIFPRETIYDIAQIRKAIKAPVASRAIEHFSRYSPRWLPMMTRQRGTRTERLFWQSGGGYDRNIDNPATLQHSMNYVHENPVRRGLVERAADWKWSSAGWYQQGKINPIIPDQIPVDWLQ